MVGPVLQMVAVYVLWATQETLARTVNESGTHDLHA